MSETTSATIGPHDDATLLSFAYAVLRWRRVLFGCAIIGAAVGVALGLFAKRLYVSSGTFVPQVATEASAAGGLAAAVSQFGIRVPGSGNGWPPATYVELLTSRTLLQPIALDTLDVPEESRRRVAVMDLLKVPAGPAGERMDRSLVGLRRWIAASEGKKFGAVEFSVTTPWPSVSLAIAQRLIDGVNKFNAQTRQSQARAERQFVGTQADQAERALRDAEDRMQSFLQRNRVASSPDLVFERDRLQRDITLRQQAYTALLQSHEDARIREVRDTPVITVLEAPALAALGESRHTAAKAAMGLILGFLAGVVIVAFRAAKSSMRPDVVAFFRELDAMLPRFMRSRRASE